MARFRRSSEDGSGLLWDQKIEGVLENISVTVYSGSGYNWGSGQFEVHLYDGQTSAIESQDPFFSANLYAHGGNSTEGHDILQYISSGYVHCAFTGSGAVFGNLR